MRVSIIIPNYNGEELLKRNLVYLVKAISNKKNNIFETIIVDDGSTDNSILEVYKFKPEIPNLKILENEKNLGFGKTINIGVRAASADVVCLINNDVEVPHDFLIAAISLFNDPKVFAVSLHEKGEGPSKGFFDNGFVGFKRGVEKNKVQSTFWVSGGSGLFRKNLWEKLGGFDEDLFSPYYWEDLDLCYRARKRGYKLLWQPQGTVVHKHESTTSKLNQKKVNLIKERNQLLFIWKNINQDRYIFDNFIGIARRVFQHPGYLKVVFAALSKYNTVLKKRKEETEETTISDSKIFSEYK